MKNKVKKLLKQKEAVLDDIHFLQKESGTSKYDKNEIEVRAQIAVLRHLLDE